MVNDIDEDDNIVQDSIIPIQHRKRETKYEEPKKIRIKPPFPSSTTQFDNKGYIVEVNHDPSGQHRNRAHHDGSYDGSVESLNSSTSSNVLSSYSAQGRNGTRPLRSSMKKRRKKDDSSINSDMMNSKQIRFAIGNEQTNV